MTNETDPPPPPRRVQMNVRVPEELKDEIDERRARRGLSRDEWVTRALRFALRSQPAPPPAPSRPRNR